MNIRSWQINVVDYLLLTLQPRWQQGTAGARPHTLLAKFPTGLIFSRYNPSQIQFASLHLCTGSEHFL